MAVYYATTSGSSGNDGLTEGTAWTLTYALTQLSAGDTLYVKAGDYGPIQQTLNTNGTQGNPIKIIGYKVTPNDIVPNDWNTLVTMGIPNTAESPVLMGTITNNRPNQDNGLVVNSDWIEFRNFASYGYNRPFQFLGDNAVIDNIYTYKSGTHNPADQGGFDTTFPTGSYTGYGVIVRSDNHLLTNCYVLDAGAEGIRVYSSNNFTHRNNKVHTILGVGGYYADPTTTDGNSTDYHYLISGNCSGGRIYNAHVEQKKGMYSDGHGIVFKSPNSSSPITDMVVDGFLVKNSKLETQFPNVTNITFRNGELTTDDDASHLDGKDANIGQNSTNITLENVRFTGGAHIAFRSWPDIYDQSYSYSANDVKILNCSFEGDGRGSAVWITHGPQNLDNWIANNVTFDHCTFNNYYRLAYMSSDHQNINFDNCIVSNMTEYYVIGYHDGAGPNGGTGGPYPLVADWVTSNFFGNSFLPPSGTNITTLDPQYDANWVTTNPSLTSAGIATTYFSAGLPIGYMGIQQVISLFYNKNSQTIFLNT